MRHVDLDDALARFLQQLRADGRSAHTLGQYERQVRLLASWARQEGLCCDVQAFGHEHLARFLTSPHALQRRDGAIKKVTSVNVLRACLRGFFGYLLRAGFIEKDPSVLIRRANGASSPPRPVAPGDQRRLMDTLAKAKGPAAARDYALFRFLLLTGCRVSAALAIEVGDMDLEAGELELRETKGGRPQRLFLPTAIQDHLREYLGERRTGPLFPSADGGRITARHAARRLRHWLEKAGAVSASPHCLRHAFAMDLYQRTRDVLLVQRALGHRSIGSTLRYAQAQDDELRAALF